MRTRIDMLRDGAASLLSPTGLRGAALELGWVATHAALYPLGAVAERARHHGADAGRRDLAGLSPVQRGLFIGDVEAAGTPILLVHGMVDNRSIFTLLRRGLRRRGFHRVLTLNYSPLTRDVRLAATGLATRIEQLCEETGFERIHVIGHSMGGLVARYYVQCLGGDARVHTLVTLGTPHAGTRAARLVPHALARQLCPGSDLVRELAEPAPGCRTRMLSVWSDLDQLMVPKRNARIDHPDLDARNVLSDGEEFDAETLVWTAGVKANPMLARTGLPLDEKGRLRCRADLRVEGVEGAWGSGDAASVPDLTGPPGSTTSPSAQHAVRQAKVLGDNIAKVLNGRSTSEYVHKHAGSVASLGLHKGVAQIYGIKLRGFPAWFMHRTYHVSRVPTLNRKIRVILDWTLALFFRRDIVSLGTLQRPRDEFSEASR